MMKDRPPLLADSPGLCLDGMPDLSQQAPDDGQEHRPVEDQPAGLDAQKGLIEAIPGQSGPGLALDSLEGQQDSLDAPDRPAQPSGHNQAVEGQPGLSAVLKASIMAVLALGVF